MTAKPKAPRKPMSTTFAGKIIQADILLGEYGFKELRKLAIWLTRVVAWAEARKT